MNVCVVFIAIAFICFVQANSTISWTKAGRLIDAEYKLLLAALGNSNNYEQGLDNICMRNADAVRHKTDGMSIKDRVVFYEFQVEGCPRQGDGKCNWDKCGRNPYIISITHTPNASKDMVYFVSDIQHYVNARTKRQINYWIHKNGLNSYGDAKNTMYLGGTPLFDEKTGRTIDRYAFILKKHPELPWITNPIKRFFMKLRHQIPSRR